MTELSRQFGLILDDDAADAASEAPGNKSNDEEETQQKESWDEWAARTVEVNASSSMFAEDDVVARQMIAQRHSTPI